MNVAVKPRLQARIRVNKPFHLSRISCKNNHKPVAVVFHSLQQCGNSLVTIVFRPTLNKRICFVDEQHSIYSGVYYFVCLHCCLSHIFSNKPGTVSLHEMPTLQYSQFPVHRSHYTCHGCLACTGMSCEHAMVRQVESLQSFFLSCFLYFHEINKRPHLFLCFFQSNQFAKFLLCGNLFLSWFASLGFCLFLLHLVFNLHIGVVECVCRIPLFYLHANIYIICRK